MMSRVADPAGDALLFCEKCGAVTFVASSHVTGRVRECMHCWSMIPRGSTGIGDAGGRFQAFTARMLRIRLYWYQGYVSRGSDELLDAQAITVSADAQRVALHATGGAMHYFDDSGEEDQNSFRIFREQPWSETSANHAPPAPTRPLLALSDTFDYVVSIPPAGQEGVCRRRQIEPARPGSEPTCLLGSSPRLHFEPVGLLPGGGSLSPLCGLIRPAVLGSRVTLSSGGAPDATAVQAHFSWPRGSSIGSALAMSFTCHCRHAARWDCPCFGAGP